MDLSGIGVLRVGYWKSRPWSFKTVCKESPGLLRVYTRVHIPPLASSPRAFFPLPFQSLYPHTPWWSAPEDEVTWYLTSLPSAKCHSELGHGVLGQSCFWKWETQPPPTTPHLPLHPEGRREQARQISGLQNKKDSIELFTKQKLCLTNLQDFEWLSSKYLL